MIGRFLPAKMLILRRRLLWIESESVRMSYRTLSASRSANGVKGIYRAKRSVSLSRSASAIRIASAAAASSRYDSRQFSTQRWTGSGWV